MHEGRLKRLLEREPPTGHPAPAPRAFHMRRPSPPVIPKLFVVPGSWPCSRMNPGWKSAATRTCVLAAATFALHGAEGPAAAPQPVGSGFRGPGRTGVAPADARPPIRFGPGTNELWSVALPKGHSSPVVLDGKVFVTAQDGDALVTLALDAATGREAWRRSVTPRRMEEVHRTLGSPASATVATDGTALYVHFGSYGMVSYGLDGTERWRRPMAVTETEYGASASPLVVGDVVVQLIDQDAGSHVVALRRVNGAEAWRVERPEMRRGFGSPVAWTHHGRTDVVLPGTIFMVGLDPATGSERWRVDGLARITCTTPVVGGDTLYSASWTTGGDRSAERIELAGFDAVLKGNDRDGDGRLAYAELPEGAARERRKHLDGNRDGHVDRAEWESMASIFARVENQAWALEAGKDGSVTSAGVRWRFKRGLPYVASPLVHDGCFYMVKNGGFLTCLDAATGQPHYREERLPAGGDYYASPVLAGGHLYLASQGGVMTVVKAGPRLEVVGRADFGEPVQATPAVVGDRLYVRTAGRLWAFANPPSR